MMGREAYCVKLLFQVLDCDGETRYVGSDYRHSRREPAALWNALQSSETLKSLCKRARL